MSTKADELKLDIDEFNNLLQQASRQRAKDVINIEIRRLQTELAKLLEEQKDTSVKSSDAKPSSSKKCYEVKLNNYGWEQTSSAVKLYITLENVHQLSKDAVKCSFTEMSLDLQVLGLDNKNYVLTINNLCEDIDPSKSSFKMKKDMIIVSLAKKDTKEWSHVTKVENTIKKLKSSSIPDMTDKNDYSTGIMNLMKKIYQEGDDEMKKAIAKAWTESQQQQQQQQL
ncbi:calcyclin-binding protein [Nomia melanderi]|uniref:calcyclin-binding protein n=1 Tax=Nomia melanderi TaxID=2448451 RepID=UPI003FCE4839